MVKNNRRGLSPVIATVLLIMIVIILAVIIFLWFRSLTREAVTKDLGFGEENIELVCEDVIMDVDYQESNGGKLTITNEGNVPISKIRLKSIKYSSYDTYDVGSTIKPGKTDTIDNSDVEFSEYDRMIVIPVLRGNSDSGLQYVACDERHGVEVYLNV